ncbi:unnamed protein product [Nesidiocoris tenuis]|uniref:Uncharacterized protein n=1 Tax=Nesidiocoris tenuis TaxID=355587 RepID=A0A6H5H407_9HEMI|nr:unnamed protein product [Nesidiocoris tenuis]CAB0010303.1 unnamed protein product [Nesidiocoris tenuis]
MFHASFSWLMPLTWSSKGSRVSGGAKDRVSAEAWHHYTYGITSSQHPLPSKRLIEGPGSIPGMGKIFAHLNAAGVWRNTTPSHDHDASVDYRKSSAIPIHWSLRNSGNSVSARHSVVMHLRPRPRERTVRWRWSRGTDQLNEYES